MNNVVCRLQQELFHFSLFLNIGVLVSKSLYESKWLLYLNSFWVNVIFIVRRKKSGGEKKKTERLSMMFSVFSQKCTSASSICTTCHNELQRMLMNLVLSSVFNVIVLRQSQCCLHTVDICCEMLEDVLASSGLKSQLGWLLFRIYFGGDFKFFFNKMMLK